MQTIHKSTFTLKIIQTEYIIFSRNKTPVHDAIKAGNNDAAAQDTVKILGITLDRNMTLERQVINTCKSIYMNIRKIRRITPYLTDYAVRTLVQTTVTVRLDTAIAYIMV